MFTTEEITLEKMQEMEFTHHCRCGSKLSVAWGGSFGVQGYVLRCGNDPQHREFDRDYEISMAESQEVPGWKLPNWRKKELEEQTKDSNKVMRYVGRTKLSPDEVRDIFKTIWPRAMAEAPDVVKRAILICLQYNLHPLMKQLHLIPFKNKNESKKQGKDVFDWAIAHGIQSDRLLARRQGPFSYIDNTPRRMTDAEQKIIFGSVDKDIHAIVKLRDPSTSAESVGYGAWPKDAEVYGAEKGNTALGMASIRAERVALDRLHPGELPEDVVTIDEQFLPKELPEQLVRKVIDATPPAPVDNPEKATTTEPPPTGDRPVEVSVVEGLDRDWYNETIALIRWNDETVKSWIGVNLKVDNTGKVTDVLARLNKEQMARFCKEIQTRRDTLPAKGGVDE
jgi:hypothetical protein